MRSAGFSIFLAASLVGCGGESGSPDGGDTRVAGEPASVDETSGAGEAASLNDMTAAALGAGDEQFGFGFTAYPGSEVSSNRVLAGSGQAVTRSDDPPAEVFSFYREQADARGFALTDEDLDEEIGSLTFARGADEFSVMGGANPVGEGYNYTIGWEDRS